MVKVEPFRLVSFEKVVEVQALSPTLWDLKVLTTIYLASVVTVQPLLPMWFDVLSCCKCLPEEDRQRGHAHAIQGDACRIYALGGAIESFWVWSQIGSPEPAKNAPLGSLDLGVGNYEFAIHLWLSGKAPADSFAQIIAL
jgi:hypothetical protein